MTVSYELRYRPRTGGGAWSAWIDAGTSTSHRLTGLSAATEYEVEVRARRNGLTSAAATGSRWTRFAAPNAPSLGNVRVDTVTLTWPAVAGANGYRVLRNGVAVESGNVAISQAGSVVTATVSGLTEQTSYTFSIAVLNPDGVASAATAAPSTTTLPIASGGTETTFTAGGTTYRVHTFTSTGNSTFTLNADRNVDYLIVAGGGGGSRSGGGGAGGLRSGSTALAAGAARTITVGAGGAGSSSTAAGTNGGNSSALGITATGGGGGGANSSAGAGNAGGSGGGGGAVALGFVNGGGAGTSGQGNNGGSSYGYVSFPGGGGGGAGGAGGTAANDGTGKVTAGAGGLGLYSSITGVSTGYAGGGAGSPYQFVMSDSPGAARPQFGGGSGGTVASGGVYTNGGSGAAGTGGGGGGAPANGTGGSGGSGVVIIRYAI